MNETMPAEVRCSGSLGAGGAWASCMWERWEPGLPEPHGELLGEASGHVLLGRGTWHLSPYYTLSRAPKGRITVRKEVGIALDLE